MHNKKARQWASFDRATTDAEFRTIPDRDVADPFKAMGLWAKEAQGGFIVKDYGDGWLMIKASNKTAGRCLFFTIDEEDPTVAVALLAYQKESDEAPKNLVKAARERRGRYLDGRRK